MGERPDFVLHPQLEADTMTVGELGVSRLLLMNDSRFPWLILAPRREGLTEWHELTPADRDAVSGEIAAASAALKRLTGADKMNIATLGNIVPQLHVHVVARRIGDSAWPGPVWRAGLRAPYPAGTAAAFLEAVRSSLDIRAAD